MSAFQEQMDRLVGTLRPGQTAGDFPVWFGEMDQTRAACGVAENDRMILGAAVTSVLLATDEHGQPLRWPIKPLTFRLALQDAARKHHTSPPALPAPERHAVEVIDPNDPYSCTPEERARWAKEDQWIREWATRLPKSLPEYAPASEVDAWKRNLSVAAWPNLTPAARRAKERRIATERARVLGGAVAQDIPCTPEPDASPAFLAPADGPLWPGAATKFSAPQGA